MEQSLALTASALWISFAFFAQGLSQGASRLLIWSTFAVLMCYFGWRVAFTILPFWHDADIFVVWVLIFLAAEILSVADFLQCCAFKSLSSARQKTTRHRVLPRFSAKRHRSTVDLLIPTYSEPVELLRKTLIRAKEIDYDHLTINLLDDARRNEVKELCRELGVTYFSRADNVGAKAGNMNNALPQLKGEFLAILDADFLAFENFAKAALPYFDDSAVGCVQFPQTFYNPDPSQINSGLFATFKDEQWHWFRRVLPERDLLDLATSCGSCSFVRRSALEAIGGRFPEETITEDFDLSLRFLERGFVTRYVNETVAIGLSPFTTQDFFKQRQRWALGNLSAWRRAFLSRKKIRLYELLLIFEWRIVSLPARVVTFLGPVVVLLFDLWPLKVTSFSEYALFTVPFIFLLCSFEASSGPRSAFGFIASQARTIGVALVLGVQFLLTPLVSNKLGFSVTPKTAGKQGADRFFMIIFLSALLSAGALAVGLYRYAEADAVSHTLEVVLAWQAYNLLLVSVATWMFRPTVAKRMSERFLPIDCLEVDVADTKGAFVATADTIDVSEGGMRLRSQQALNSERYKVLFDNEWADVEVLRCVRISASEWHISLVFSDPNAVSDHIVRLIYSQSFKAEIL
ncbi:MAG: glycosyltransferase family 2 protein [Pseudomonadota bacterium]